MIVRFLPGIARLVAVVITLAVCTGCPFRKERITIGRTGSVHIVATFEGSAEEMARFDALPSPETGWKIERSIKEEKGPDGKPKETHVLAAERKFGSGMPLSRNYAKPGDLDADLVLDFPTEVRLEDRADGLYLVFRRVYSPRAWAYADYWDDLFIDDEIKKLTEKPTDQLTMDERVKIVEALAAIQANRQIEFAARALAEVEPDLLAEHRVRARRALLDVYEQKHDQFPAIIDRCEPKLEDERDRCFEEETQRVLSDGLQAYRTALQIDGGMHEGRLARFDRAYERAKRYYDITNDLGGNRFEIEVAMPGKVIAHNADEVKDDESGRRIFVWGFDGRAFRDREHELVVVTKVGPPSSVWTPD